MARVKVVVNEAEVIALFQPGGQVGRAARRGALVVTRRARRLSPKDTGWLRNSIKPRLKRQRLRGVTWTIGSPLHYAIYQELGTGPIYAKNAPFLVFQVNGHWVRTRSTRGIPPQLYLTSAIHSITARDLS